MKKYEELKNDTYMFLLSDKEESKKLISAILIISLCHDNCIKDDELLVSKYFIQKCANLVSFNQNYEKMSKLDEQKKFSLIRNKLAHGDFVYNEEKNELVIKYQLNGEEIITSISVNSVIDYANEIVNYYDYLDAKMPRKKIMVNRGFKLITEDIPKNGKNRNRSYNVHYRDIINHFLYKHDLIMYEFSYAYRNVLKNNPWMEINISYEEAGENERSIENPYENNLIRPLLKSLNSPNEDLGKYKDIIELLRKFYVMYIYPLENFLKVDDKNIYSLKNEEMFDFSRLDLENISRTSSYNNVGKVNNYAKQLNDCYQKISLLMEKKNHLDSFKNSNSQKLIKDRESLQEEINEYVDLFCKSSVQALYRYSDNRSIIEHLRCSIMHGNYVYDFENKVFEFTDLWKNDEHAKFKLTINEFEKILAFENVNVIIEHFNKNSNKSK